MVEREASLAVNLYGEGKSFAKTTKEKIVKTGIRHEDLIEIVEGIKQGENVVVVGQQNLSEGVKVRVNVAR